MSLGGLGSIKKEKAVHLLISIATLCSAARVHLRAVRSWQGQISHASTLKEGIFVHVLFVATLKGYNDLSLQYGCFLNYYLI